MTDTVKVSRRPSTFSRVASAATDEPTLVGARWSTCTRMPDGGLTGGQPIADGGHRGLLHQGDHPGGAEHLDLAGPEGDGGVVVGDDQLGAPVEAGGERHLGTIRRTPAAQPRGAPCSTTTSSNAP